MLEYAGGRIKGKTRIHKGLFILHEDVDHSLVSATFKPRDYGPWSPASARALHPGYSDALLPHADSVGSHRYLPPGVMVTYVLPPFYLFEVAEIEYSRDVALRKIVTLTVILIPWLMAVGTLLPP